MKKLVIIITLLIFTQSTIVFSQKSPVVGKFTPNPRKRFGNKTHHEAFAEKLNNLTIVESIFLTPLF